jgi:type III secretion protein N (ATPase)
VVVSAERVGVGCGLLGRAVAGDGTLLAGSALRALVRRPLRGSAPSPAERRPLRAPFWTGVRALDGPLAFGCGARIGIVGAPGAGKSSVLEAIAAGSDADATVVALIGERGREAERWLSRLDARTTIVCATADRSAAERLRAAELAFAHACALRARGLAVLVLLDSLARVAAAARDLAVAAGEPVGRAGFPASVVARQARLLELAGPTAAGSITVIATVLSDGPAEADPIAAAALAALDGHVVLAPRLANAGWFPAIDLPASASRTLAEVADPAHRAGAAALRAAVAALEEGRDARALGIEPSHPSPLLARALAAEDAIAAFLRQDAAPSPPALTLARLAELRAALIPGFTPADIPDDGRLR